MGFELSGVMAGDFRAFAEESGPRSLKRVWLGSFICTSEDV